MLTARIEERRGSLVGALVVRDGDELFAITSSGVIIRFATAGLRYLSRATGGVKLMSLAGGDSIVAVARNREAEQVPELEQPAEPTDEATGPEEER